MVEAGTTEYESPGLGTTIWSPLGSGLLTCKYAQAIPEGSRITTPGDEFLQKSMQGRQGDATLAKIGRVTVLAGEVATAPVSLAIAWCLRNPHMFTVLLCATRSEQLTQNLSVIELLPRIDNALAARLDAAAPRVADPDRLQPRPATLALRMPAGVRRVLDLGEGGGRVRIAAFSGPVEVPADLPAPVGPLRRVARHKFALCKLCVIFRVLAVRSIRRSSVHRTPRPSDSWRKINVEYQAAVRRDSFRAVRRRRFHVCRARVRAGRAAGR